MFVCDVIFLLAVLQISTKLNNLILIKNLEYKQHILIRTKNISTKLNTNFVTVMKRPLKQCFYNILTIYLFFKFFFLNIVFKQSSQNFYKLCLTQEIQ